MSEPISLSCVSTVYAWEEVRLPVCGCLPGSIEHAIEHVEEHGANVATVSPIEMPVFVVNIGIHFRTCVVSLESIATTPNSHGEEEECCHAELGTHGAGEALAVESVAKDAGADDLGRPIKDGVEGSSADVEPCRIDILEMIGVEPI